MWGYRLELRHRVPYTMFFLWIRLKPASLSMSMSIVQQGRGLLDFRLHKCYVRRYQRYYSCKYLSLVTEIQGWKGTVPVSYSKYGSGLGRPKKSLTVEMECSSARSSVLPRSCGCRTISSLSMVAKFSEFKRCFPPNYIVFVVFHVPFFEVAEFWTEFCRYNDIVHRANYTAFDKHTQWLCREGFLWLPCNN